MEIVSGILLSLLKFGSLSVQDLRVLIPYAKANDIRRVLLRLQNYGLVEKHECKKGKCFYTYNLTEAGKQKILDFAFKIRFLENMLFGGVLNGSGTGRTCEAIREAG